MNQVKPGSGGRPAESPGSAPVRVLTLSGCFPNPVEKDFGVFIERRMKRVAEKIHVSVLAPVPVMEYGNPKRVFTPLKEIPHQVQNGPLEVYYPRWFYPPLGGWSNGPILGLQMLPHARRLDANGGVDVIDAHFAHPEGVAAAVMASRMKKPFVVTLRGAETDHAVHAPRRKAMAWALKRAARVISVSERLRQFAIGLGCDPERAVTIPNGIDGSNFYPRGKTSARKEFGLPADRKLILSAGYLIERKGHHRVAQSLRELLDRGVNAYLAIAGGPGREGDFEATIRQTVADLKLENDVRFLGAVAPEALAKLMSACDVFALATSNEGWPNVVHEAMGCGAPVVGTDIGAIPDMIQSDDFGYVVPFGDQKALTDALARALTRTWKRDVISGWALARSWDNVAAEVVSLFKTVIAEDRKRRNSTT
ncbi:MAG: glycosyltransferase [Bryobacterales bacterium]|nr:glycosyltransferase [Bryobacterales bacterium]